MVRVAINGFGRIGRRVLRAALDNKQIQIVAVNDLTPPNVQAHLFKYDSVHGTLDHEVRLEGDMLHVGSQNVRLTAERDPAKLPWKELGVDIVMECTGLFTDKAKASAHLTAGAKKVLISAPSKDADLTICMGINEGNYDSKQHTIVSNASCTTNCLAPVVKVLDDSFGIVRGLMTTVHSYTNDQNVLDLPHKDLRRARAAALSMIPTTTGAAKAIGLVLPHLKGKLDGYAVRVPTPNVSLVDLTVQLTKNTTAAEINAKLEAASK
ncbi:MAG: type I glyceraldehyde-3-phosphate dehydrogenase, partial [Deltaproteobacteria bacterium]|nr:type I glyceraldehyde-3-phosphate dehydrogenase [Deltaproteobacteria bacterium]